MKIFYFVISKCFFLAFIFYTAFAQGSTTCTTGSSTDGDGNTCFQACGCDAYSRDEVRCPDCSTHNNTPGECTPIIDSSECECNRPGQDTLHCPSCLGRTYKLNTNISVTAGGSCPSKTSTKYTCDATDPGNWDTVCPFCASAQIKNSGDICCQNGSEVSSTVVGVDCCPSGSTPHTGTTCPAPPPDECGENTEEITTGKTCCNNGSPASDSEITTVGDKSCCPTGTDGFSLVTGTSCPSCPTNMRPSAGEVCCNNGSPVSSSTVGGVHCCPTGSTPTSSASCSPTWGCSANEYLNKDTHKCCWNADSGNSGVVDDDGIGSYTDGPITCNTDAELLEFSPNLTQLCGCDPGYAARCVFGDNKICGNRARGWTCMGSSNSHSKCCDLTEDNADGDTCVESSSACDRISANTHYCCPDKSTPTEQGDECPSACPAGQELGDDQICCDGSDPVDAVDGCCPEDSTPYTGNVCPGCGTATLTTGQACCEDTDADPANRYKVYNTSTHSCCANGTDNGTVYNTSTQGCCNNESPNLPTVYSKSSSSEGSCGTAEKCWSTSANTACCGTGDDAEVYSTATADNKSCCGTGANAAVYSTATADNKSCCGTGASAEVYSTAAADNQSCCKKSSTPGSNDDVYNTSTHGCCNHQTTDAAVYDKERKECCGASNPKTVVNSGTCTFCNGVQFNTSTQDCCCETTIYPKNTKGCCNTEDVCYGVFNPSTHLCCQNTGVTPITPSRCVSTPSACKSVPSLCHSHKPIRKYVSISDPKDFAFRSNVSMVGRKYYRSRFTVGRADRPDYICHKLDASGNIVEGGFLPQYLCPSLTICPYGTQCACTKSTGESVKDTRCEYAYVNPLRDSGSRTENQQSPHTFHGFETIVIQKVEP